MSHPRQPVHATSALDPEPGAGRPWPRVRWEYSLLLPIGLMLLLATLVFAESREDVVDYTVTSSVSGEPVAGAGVSVGNVHYRTGTDGTITIGRPEPGTPIVAMVDGYRTFRAETRSGTAREQVLQVTPSVVRGEVVDAASGEAIDGAEIAILDSSGTVIQEAKTDASGAYMFKHLPTGASLRVERDTYGAVEVPVEDREVIILRLEMKVISGSVLDDAGEPVRGAVVEAGAVRAVTGADGLFILEGVSPGAEVRVTAAGFLPLTRIAESGELELRLEPQVIRGVYANRALLATPGGIDHGRAIGWPFWGRVQQVTVEAPMPGNGNG